MLQQQNREPRIYKADRMLQMKVGSGPLDEAVIRQCQEVMNNNDFDFAPMGAELLEDLSRELEKARLARFSESYTLNIMTDLAMQIKGNAALFHYPFVSKLAEIMLFFLENIQEIDGDAVEVIDAHHRAISTLLDQGIQEDDGNLTQDFEKELKSLCGRYFAKKKIRPEDAYFVDV